MQSRIVKLLTRQVTSISAIDSREFSLLPAVKRQGSMKNLRGSDDGRASDDDNGLELSDFDELAAKSRA